LLSGVRVLLAPNGLGLGHVKRVEVLDEELKKAGCLTFYSTYLDAYRYCKARGLPAVESIPISYGVSHDGSVDYKATLTSNGLSMGFRRFLQQVTREIQVVKAFKPHLILSDSRASSIIAGKLLGKPVILLINQLKVYMVNPKALKLNLFDKLILKVAYLFWVVLNRILEVIWSQANLILIPDFPLPYTICKMNLEIPKGCVGKLRFIGPLLRYRPEDLEGVEKLRRKHGLTGSRPILYAAISGPAAEKRSLLKTLQPTLISLSHRYQVVLTMGEPGVDHPVEEVKIGLFKATPSKLTTYPWVDEKTHCELLKACDLVLCRAGHGIITKAMVYGKPMILIPIPNHSEQWSNAAACGRIGYGVIMDQRNLRPETLMEAVKRALTLKPRSIGLNLDDSLVGGKNSIVHLLSTLTPFHPTRMNRRG